MKLLHTADWHLGQTFFEYDRKAEHTVFLKFLIEKIIALQVDVLLIAGDIFDGPNPSAEAQKMYYSFLRTATTQNPQLQIIIIAGNHDSAARLEAVNPLLESLNVIVRGLVKRDNNGVIDFNNLIIPLHCGGYCLAVPYLRQGDYPDAETYAQGVQRMYQTLYEYLPDKSKPVIVLGHLQATGSEISENDRAERTVIGGLECISPEAFSPAIAYTALGHLHRSQRVSGRENVRYAGAPLPMSFAEKNNKQSLTLVTITDTTKIERIEFETPVKLLSIPDVPKPLSEVIETIQKLPNGVITNTSPYLEIKVLITEPEPTLRYAIEENLKGKSVRLARIAAIIPQKNILHETITCEELRSIHPMDMAVDIFKRKYGGDDMPDNLKRLLANVIREIER